MPEAPSLADDLLHEALHALRRVDLALPQDGVQEAVSQTVSVLHAVVLAGHRVAGQQRMIDGVAVVPVVGGAGLPSVHDDWKAVDVDGHPACGVVASGGTEMTLAGVGQRVAQRRPIAGRERQQIDQPRLRGLTGQALVERLLAGTIPSGQLHGRIMGQAIGVVLGR